MVGYNPSLGCFYLIDTEIHESFLQRFGQHTILYSFWRLGNVPVLPSLPAMRRTRKILPYSFALHSATCIRGSLGRFLGRHHGTVKYKGMSDSLLMRGHMRNQLLLNMSN